MSIDAIGDAIVAKRKLSLIMGLGSGMFLMFFIWGDFNYYAETYSWFGYVYGVVKWMGIVPWLFAILGYGRVSKSQNLLSKSNNAFKTCQIFALHY